MRIKTNTAFNGVVILTIALIMVKILSAIYRVPYQNVLGDAGLYAYQQVYPLVALGVILSMNAIPSAVTQTLGNDRQHGVYTKVYLRLQWCSVALFLIVCLGAQWIAQLMGDSNLAPMLRTASISFLFIAILGVLRGYYQSQQQMNIPAISQVLEQVIRVAIIMVAIVLYSNYNWSIYASGALAIAGSALGFLVSSLFLLQQKPFKFQQTTQTIAWRQLSLAIIVFAVSHLIVILWQIIDSFTMIHALQLQGLSFNNAITLKGIFDRGASFIQMGLIVTTTFCFVLIPLLTDAKKQGQSILMNRYANVSLKITMVISTAASIGLINLLPVMNRVFFENDSQTATLIVYMLTVICVSLIMMEMSLLQVVNNEKIVFIGCAVGMITKGILNIILIPQIGLLGGSCATVLSLVVTVLILQRQVLKHYHIRNLKIFSVKLTITMVVMSCVVQLCLWLIPSTGRLSGLIELLIAAVVGVVTLISAIIWMKILKYRELKHLPFGDKIYHIKRGRH
ncbi:oligosaccharide flippase family protein [Staphylococcus arlettae]|uniref:oligosaccharide flippase family protein n=1 Tax=Staphylococcus arlettae TaxID=29378 RepID=UPI003EDEBE7D